MRSIEAQKSLKLRSLIPTLFFCFCKGSIDLFKLPHSKCRRFNLKEFWERRESNPGLLDEKRERYLCAMLPPLVQALFTLEFNETQDLAVKNKSCLNCSKS